MASKLQSEVVIYTDGACDPNPGPGGWAAILLYEKDEKIHCREISGGEPETTNNRMEILAVLEGLKALKRPCFVTVYSDSQYVVKSIGSWLDGKPRSGHWGWMVRWQGNDWTKKDGELKNVDLWQAIYAEVQKHKGVNLAWIRGHTGHEYNDRCDYLAVVARKGNVVPSDGLRPDGAPQDPGPDWPAGASDSDCPGQARPSAGTPVGPVDPGRPA